MKELNLLFLSPHWRVTLVKAFQEALNDLPCRGKLVGADSDPHSPALQVLNPDYTLSRFTSPGCLDETLNICRREAVHAIIPLTNKAVEFLDAGRAAFAAENIRLVLNDRAAIEICHDKFELAQFCRREGIPSPETFPIGENKIPFPLIAKQRRGEGGKNCMVLEDERDLKFCAAKHPGHVVQPLIRGMEYSVDWFSGQDGEPIVIVPRERLTIRAGEVMVSRIHMHPGVIEAVRAAGARLGLRGPCTLQGILDEAGRFFLTDVNLRFGSGSVHTINAGGNIPLLICKELLGEPLPSTVDSIRDGSVMTRFSDAFYI